MEMKQQSSAAPTTPTGLPKATAPMATVPEKKKSPGWKEMKAWQKAITIIIAIFFLFVFYIVLDANKYRATVRVIEGEGQVGVNPTDRALDFGDLSLGTSAVRRVDMNNGTPVPFYVIMLKTGRISELIKIDKNYFRLAPGENIKIEYTVYMPASAKIDDTYNGRVYLFKLPTF